MRDVFIVEINPFVHSSWWFSALIGLALPFSFICQGPVTGGALFNWTQERKLLQGGIDVWGDLDGSSEEEENPETFETVDMPVLRLVTQVPSYVNKDYLMAFPVLQRAAELSKRRDPSRLSPTGVLVSHREVFFNEIISNF